MITVFDSDTQSTTVPSEHSLASVNVQGIFSFEIDLFNLAANDIIELKIYKIILTGGTKRVLAYAQFYGVQPTHDVIKIAGPFYNDLTDSNSLEFAINQTHGSSRNYAWKVLKHDSLAPTTSGRTLDVTTTGEAGVDWNNVGTPGATVNLSATTVGVIGTGGIAAGSFAAGAIDASAIAANAITNSELAQSAAQEIADEVLNRDIAGGGSGGARIVRDALRALRNRRAISAGTLTVYQEDDTASAWTAAVTTTAGDPTSQIDPA